MVFFGADRVGGCLARAAGGENGSREAGKFYHEKVAQNRRLWTFWADRVGGCLARAAGGESEPQEAGIFYHVSPERGVSPKRKSKPENKPENEE